MKSYIIPPEVLEDSSSKSTQIQPHLDTFIIDDTEVEPYSCPQEDIIEIEYPSNIIEE
jgi:hypothetical protein